MNDTSNGLSPSLSPEQKRNADLKEIRTAIKHVPIGKDQVEYIDRLLLKTESVQFQTIFEETTALEHSDMQTPLSQARFLEFLVKLTKAKRVLEVGTFKGFSAAYLARSLPEDGKVITIERDLRYLDIIYSVLEKAEVDKKIEVRNGLAGDILRQLEIEGQQFDIAFIDADKHQYEDYLEYCMKLVRVGGVVLVDNVLWAGLVAYEDPGDNVGRNLKKFNEIMFDKYGVQACLIPAWDGMVMILK